MSILSSCTSMNSNAQHCSFVLLAEFDIDRGAQLTYQFPQPLGTDEGLLANLMLPDGAEKQLEDWTIFFLNQTAFNTIEPVLALEPSDPGDGKSSGKELLHVLNLVRTKHDKTVRRGAVVKAMAICTRHPYIQIFKPVLLLALDDYYNEPSQDCLARLFDAVNSMDISAAPLLTRAEKLVMRSSDVKSIFMEKFHVNKLGQDALHPSSNTSTSDVNKAKPFHKPTGSQGSLASFREGVMMRNAGARQAMSTEGPVTPSESSSFTAHSGILGVESETSDSATAVGSVPSITGGSAFSAHSNRGRTISNDTTSISSYSGPRSATKSVQHLTSPSVDAQVRANIKDTRFFPASIIYKGHKLPIKLPLSTFPEEVGDYSIIQLVQLLSQPNLAVSGPQHPHLHSNGSLTHPVILLFNALITGKRIIFLGHNRPAGTVSSFVLSACALGGGCGVSLRGFIERAFPYANLTNKDEWENVPAYITGVTNPIFEASGNWDLLIDITGLRMVVSKDILSSNPVPASLPTLLGTSLARAGTFKGEGLGGGPDEDLGRPAGRSEFKDRGENSDTTFIEDITAAIADHIPEGHIRNRFTEYVTRFTRLASRYEEETVGSTKTGFPTSHFVEGHNGHLGSGLMFLDDSMGMKELSANAHRIEGWRKTEIYRYLEQDFQNYFRGLGNNNVDISHQLSRLRSVKNMPDAEVRSIMRYLVSNLSTYEFVVDLLAHASSNGGSLHPISFGLFHQDDVVREQTVDVFEKLRVYPVGVLFLQSLNHFHRYAYIRQAHKREVQTAREPHPAANSQLYPPTMYSNSRAPSIANRSESSLGVV